LIVMKPVVLEPLALNVQPPIVLEYVAVVMLQIVPAYAVDQLYSIVLENAAVAPPQANVPFVIVLEHVMVPPYPIVPVFVAAHPFPIVPASAMVTLFPIVSESAVDQLYPTVLAFAAVIP
jgi:hypothetical protein